MDEISIIIGGKAGEGINQAGVLVGRLLAALGYRLYLYVDYPSLIRGGHNFAVIRASGKNIGAHRDAADFILALNQDAVSFHGKKLSRNGILIYDSNTVKADGMGIPLSDIIKEENAIPIMRNTCIIGAFAKCCDFSWEMFEKVLRKSVSKEIDLNIKIAKRGYDAAKKKTSIETRGLKILPAIAGNDALSLGFVKAGLKAYLSYPMTPSSSILHFLAENDERFGLKVFHPEGEIAAVNMASGLAYAGDKTACGTSGGGFCLMTEGLSLAGMTETPIVIVVSQRPGPSTGVPTYTAQSDLNFILNAGHGEFPRFAAAPGDAEEAYYLAQAALNISWKFQIPSLLLLDKTLSEGVYSFDIDSVEKVDEESGSLWNGKAPYKRYLCEKSGISQLAFPGNPEAVVKANSYEHDEYGITTEEPADLIAQQDKRWRKVPLLREEIKKYGPVKVYGKSDAKTAVVSWGSNKYAAKEAAEALGIRAVHVRILSPFPSNEIKTALSGAENIIAVENNKTAELVSLCGCAGIGINNSILKYDGRPFSYDELQAEIKKRI